MKEYQKNTIELDLQRWLLQLRRWWWVIGLSFGVALMACYFYLRYATYEHQASAILLIKEAGTNNLISEENIVLGQAFQDGQKGMDNEVEILRSSPLMETVVERLQLNVRVFRQGRFKEQEFYNNAPFYLDTFALKYGSANFYIQLIDNNTFLVKRDPDGSEGERYSYGQYFTNDYGTFLITPRRADEIVPGIYRVQIMPVEIAASIYRAKLSIERVGSFISSSLLRLKLKDPVSDKAADILRTLIEVYNEEEIRDKNLVLRNTMDFIDQRLRILEGELDTVEGGIEIFRRNNALLNETASDSRSFVISELRVTLNEIAEIETRNTLLSNIEQMVIMQQDSFHLLPANVVTEVPAISTLVNRYNDLIIEYQNLRELASSENPARQRLEREVFELRDALLLSIRNTRSDLNIPLSRLRQHVSELEQKVFTTPGIDQRLLEKRRLQSIKESLYLTLLEKREETALSMAVTTPGTRVVEPAKGTRSPIAPKPRLVYIAGGLLGLLLPIVGISLYGFLNTKVRSEDEVKRATNMPIVGRILKGKNDLPVVVVDGERTAISESFRQLRAHLNFAQVDQSKKTIAISSYASGEGKSFIAINLALAYALSAKKVLLLGLDLRRPRLAHYLSELNPDQGLTKVLLRESSWQDMLQHYQGVDVLTCGPTPPNPAELLEHSRTQQLLLELKDYYDIIIVDTPPVGLVSDSLLIRNLVDVFLLVVRHNYTEHGMLNHLEEMHAQGELPKAKIVLNAVDRQAGQYYSYFGKGYGQNYYE